VWRIAALRRGCGPLALSLALRRRCAASRWATVAVVTTAQWLPMINLIFVVLTPMAIIVSETLGGSSTFSDYSEVRQAWANFGR